MEAVTRKLLRAGELPFARAIPDLYRLIGKHGHLEFSACKAPAFAAGYNTDHRTAASVEAEAAGEIPEKLEKGVFGEA